MTLLERAKRLIQALADPASSNEFTHFAYCPYCGRSGNRANPKENPHAPNCPVKEAWAWLDEAAAAAATLKSGADS